MNFKILGMLTALIGSGLTQPAAFAQSADRAQNLSICMSGLGTCDYAMLSEPEKLRVAASDHQRNVAYCRMGSESCDPSKLSPVEANALAVARYQQNLFHSLDGKGEGTNEGTKTTSSTFLHSLSRHPCA
jgi:hypothetical protein